MASDTVHQPSTRVLLWAPPRSLSTVFEKCMSFVEDVQIIHEPYLCAKQSGPEKRSGDMNDVTKGFQEMLKQSHADAQHADDIQGWDDKDCTFQWIKDTLEADYPNKKFVFCKDMITGIVGKFDMIPRGYRHTFLLRNPTKVVYSMRKLITKVLPPSVPVEMFRLDQVLQKKGDCDIAKLFFGDMVELIDYLDKEGLEKDPIIIDADDLQNHTESILRQYCEAVGFPYSDGLLKWDAGDDIVKKNWLTSKTLLQGNKTVSFYAAAFASTEFQPPKDPPSTDQLTPDVIELASRAMPFYQQLYERRLKP